MYNRPTDPNPFRTGDRVRVAPNGADGTFDTLDADGVYTLSQSPCPTFEEQVRIDLPNEYDPTETTNYGMWWTRFVPADEATFRAVLLRTRAAAEAKVEAATQVADAAHARADRIEAAARYAPDPDPIDHSAAVEAALTALSHKLEEAGNLSGALAAVRAASTVRVGDPAGLAAKHPRNKIAAIKDLRDHRKTHGGDASLKACKEAMDPFYRSL